MPALRARRRMVHRRDVVRHRRVVEARPVVPVVPPLGLRHVERRLRHLLVPRDLALQALRRCAVLGVRLRHAGECVHGRQRLLEERVDGRISAGTRCMTTCRSMRSSKGPERRPQ